MTTEDEIFVKESTESGEKYGFPKCCIDAFVAQNPGYMKNRKPTREDLLRFDAAHVNGVFTGFVPCIKHAKMIKLRQTTLSDLIDYETRKDHLPFPHGWMFK